MIKTTTKNIAGYEIEIMGSVSGKYGEGPRISTRIFLPFSGTEFEK